ncbi:uncharacterized protein LOC129765952 [Toxorhynchites rutilus septentrionalis]|uniref:uncharacterized protein LOC129765952 n=1 Tax=Toxorhynchites rutilus septentrionalis TaxID=329112 RepID=UPI002479CD95|nr:uncharacterized protein LOC129765952 [Toxorhynchites rutilus septentrionalis]
MVLPAKHRFTRLLLRHYHEKLLHAGPQLLLGTCRLRFWPLGGRSVVRHITHQCRTCFRIKPRATQQLMGELPSPRVTAARPFQKSGVDYFGPVYIRPGPRRTAVKAYVALFVCLCTKAVHLELASDLSTERFLQALRRFTGHRGRCTDIYSDNVINFVGARNQLKELLVKLKDRNHLEIIQKECSIEGINWHFNTPPPPSAPHFGGLWEAAVRSAKFHLLRVIGNHPVCIEDMQTLLVQAETCLNSRPMTVLSDNPNDLEPLTPAHFLIGASIQQLPDQDFQTIPVNRLKHWQLVQRRLQDFWRKWHREYLSQLQGRSKRWRASVNIEIGNLVVLCDENQPPTRWKMARIQELHPGTDGVVRVVTVKTATGLLKRPVEKICILPDPDNEKEVIIKLTNQSLPFPSYPNRRGILLFFFQKYGYVCKYIYPA